MRDGRRSFRNKQRAKAGRERIDQDTLKGGHGFVFHKVLEDDDVVAEAHLFRPGFPVARIRPEEMIDRSLDDLTFVPGPGSTEVDDRAAAVAVAVFMIDPAYDVDPTGLPFNRKSSLVKLSFVGNRESP